MHVFYINILENYQKEGLTSTLQRAVKFELTTELRKIYITLLKKIMHGTNIVSDVYGGKTNLTSLFVRNIGMSIFQKSFKSKFYYCLKSSPLFSVFRRMKNGEASSSVI